MKRSTTLPDTPNRKRRNTGSNTRKNNPDSTKDVLSEISNTMLSSPPVTPTKQRVVNLDTNANKMDEGRRKLDFLSPPSTPEKICKTSAYSKAKALFQRGAQSARSGLESLEAREKEAYFLKSFLLENINTKTSNSLYVSGPPGTGKTAQLDITLNHVMKKIGNDIGSSVSQFGNRRNKFVKINCMSIRHPENIFHEIYCACEMTGKHSTSYSRRRDVDDLFQLLMHQDQVDSVTILLDELDHLITKDEQVLFQLFNLASPQKSEFIKTKLILIGISNALDFTDKFLPRLKRNCMSPQLLTFMPYTCDQIKQIIISKLTFLKENDKENVSSDTSIPIFQLAAIQLCCKKTGSVTGDLRKAFDICYKSIELVEKNLRKEKFSLTECPKVSISHVASICENSFKENSLTRLKNLNFLQKSVLCCLVNHRIKHTLVDVSSTELTVNALYDYYTSHTVETMNHILGKLRKCEFIEIISALDACSVISLCSGKSAKTTEIGSKYIKPIVAYEDLLKSLGDTGVLHKILQGGLPS